LTIALEKTEGGCKVILTGENDVSCAAELKSQLLEALSDGGEVQISFAAATAIDTTVFQLLWAAGEQARRAESVFRICSPVPAPIVSALAAAGLQPFLARLQAT
jgi:anti-anti-sigma regulatory factor